MVGLDFHRRAFKDNRCENQLPHKFQRQVLAYPWKTLFEQAEGYRQRVPEPIKGIFLRSSREVHISMLHYAFVHFTRLPACSVGKMKPGAPQRVPENIVYNTRCDSYVWNKI